MVYLVILFSVAGVGIASLWVQQRRERAHLESVEGFRSSLKAIAPRNQPLPVRRSRATARRRSPHGAHPRRVHMDAQRREAARRRVQARRRARARAMHARAAR